MDSVAFSSRGRLRISAGSVQAIIDRTYDAAQSGPCHDQVTHRFLTEVAENAGIHDADLEEMTGQETMTFEWSLTYFLIQVVAGFLGAHVAALVAHEHRFGFVGHSLVGLVAGACSGFFLQRIVMTTVTGTGDAMPITELQAHIYQAACGLVIGAMAMLMIGVLRYEMAKSSGE